MAHGHQHSAVALSVLIPREKLELLFRLQPHRHLLALIGDWLLIGTSIWATLSFPNPLVYVLAVIVIGARMHALAILMHDATHFRFLKNRKWNDVLTNWLTMYPLFTSIATCRQNHLRHHQYLNTEADPDWVAKLGKVAFTFPKPRAEFMATVRSYFTLYRGLSDAIWFLQCFQAPTARHSAASPERWSRWGFYLLLFSVLTLTGTWLYFLLFWVVPYLPTFFMFQYVCSVAEHYGEMEYEDELTSSRTVRTTTWERFLLAPHQVAYHLEHHLYPGVPFYNLPKLHRLLMERDDYRARAHITQGYLSGLLRELGENSRA